MIFETVTDLHIWRYTDEKSNKVWGYFCHDQVWYAFWGAVTQAMSFKDHGSWAHDLPRLARSKQAKGYQPIELTSILEDNPQWILNFNDRFTWFKLLTSTNS